MTKSGVSSLRAQPTITEQMRLCVSEPRRCLSIKKHRWLLLEKRRRNWGKASLSGWFICFQLAPYYVKQHFRWAKDSAMAVRSAAQCPWYCHGKRCIWPSCSVKLPPRPTCIKLSSPNSLMRLSRDSISWKGAGGKPEQPSNATFSRLCAPISFPPLSRHSSSDDYRWPVCSSTSQERALDVEVFTARGLEKSFLDILDKNLLTSFRK